MNSNFCDLCGFGPCQFSGNNESEFQGIFAGLTALPYGGEFTLADLGLDVQTMELEVEDDTLARVIAEVRAGSILMPEEGEVLLKALVDEELAHAETLADAYEVEDELDAAQARIAELEAQVAAQNALLGLANFGLELAMDTILRQEAHIAGTELARDLAIALALA